MLLLFLDFSQIWPRCVVLQKKAFILTQKRVDSIKTERPSALSTALTTIGSSKSTLSHRILPLRQRAKLHDLHTQLQKLLGTLLWAIQGQNCCGTPRRLLTKPADIALLDSQDSRQITQHYFDKNPSPISKTRAKASRSQKKAQMMKFRAVRPVDLQKRRE